MPEPTSGLIAGAVADALGYGGAIALVAGLTAASALWVVHDMPPDRGGSPQSVITASAA